MRLAILSLALALGGCAASVLTATPRSVVVLAPTGGVVAGAPLAEQECMKQGRHARYIGTDRAPSHLVFDCVE